MRISRRVSAAAGTSLGARVPSGIAAAAAATLLAATPASAITTVTRSGDSLVVMGDARANNIDVQSTYERFTRDQLEVVEYGADAVQAGPGCARASDGDANQVVCGSAIDIGVITVALGDGADRFSITQLTDGLNPGYRSFVDGGPGGDDITGNVGADTIAGGPGNDTLVGQGGDDRIDGQDGNDLIFEDRSLSGSERGDDVYNGGPGRDKLFASGTAAGKDRYSGGPGRDEMGYAARSSRVLVKLDGRANDGARGEHDFVKADFEKVIGGSGNDVLKAGRHGRVVLSGMTGDDKLITRNHRRGDRVICGPPLNFDADLAIVDRGDSTKRGFCARVRRKR